MYRRHHEIQHVRWTVLITLLAGSLAFASAVWAADGPPPQRSWPKDVTPYARPTVPDDTLVGKIHPRKADGPSIFMVDTVVNNTNPTLKATDEMNDGETSIAVNPVNPNEITITAFSGAWGRRAPLWHSIDGGQTWTKLFTIPVPPGVPGTGGCPCDQTIEYGRGTQLFGIIQTDSPTNDYGGATTDPTDAEAWQWLLDDKGRAVQTNSARSAGDADQPWLRVGRDPGTPGQDNVYVAYDDFQVTPTDMRVAVARASNPPRFTIDRSAGVGPTGGINPGLRLAVDPRRGFVYSAFQQYVGTGAGDSVSIDYMLNRSADGGNTWGVNGSPTGIRVARADSTQPTPKFGTVNALLGGVDHAAVDPVSGDLYYVYGTRDSATGKNRLSIVRFQDDGAGGLVKGAPSFVTDQVQAAIPSVAVTNTGTVGVFYYTFDGSSADGFPIFSSHLALSNDRGHTFTDNRLLTFLSSAKDNGEDRQRVLGDYMQMKTLGCTFYGAFTGNGAPFGRTISNHDPIFFKTSACPAATASVNQSTFSVGETLVAGANISSSGFPGTADVYVGLLRPDGSVQFFTSTGIVVGSLADVTSYRPLATGVSLATPFSVSRPSFYTHQWTGSEPRGPWVFFVAAVTAGALADGSLTNDKIHVITAAPFSFP